MDIILVFSENGMLTKEAQIQIQKEEEGGGGGYELSSYAKVKEEIQSCGFDFAYAIYEENIPSGVDSFYSHNHE